MYFHYTLSFTITRTLFSFAKKITMSKEIGNTVYDVTADFDTEGKQSLFQQFKELILNSSQN